MLGIVVAYLLLLFTLFSIPSLADTGNELPTRSTSSAQDLVESLNRRSPLGLPKLAREAKARGLPTIAPSLRQMKDRAGMSYFSLIVLSPLFTMVRQKHIAA
jgi:hypothetical protein